MKTWLSGMSPAAAEVASAWSAEGVIADDVVVATVCVDRAAVEVGGAFVVDELPQPLSATAPASRIGSLTRRIVETMLAPGA
jgi:hypothetical protein